jgi:hypothetical protein
VTLGEDDNVYQNPKISMKSMTMMMYKMFVTRMMSAITTLMTLTFMNAMVSFTTRHGQDVLDNYDVHVH